ncbi:glycosyltransferase family 1 protein [Fulvivirga sp. RKSG066]|uniref:glycosyltransferase family 4 protein n=1 Tax=Fulvivirga aurantia TaxID=2529383 RepID=UPI0012BD01C0|nr:glycosyltransferase family 4 protein [Fulvivirga aurantia]MTI22751.1 glycosyltransferase family 1 protein [Fulvivirga aurantia]
MRIGMILDKTFPPDSRVENEAISLIDAGHEVFLFCLHYGEASDEEVINGIQVRRYKSNKLEYKLSALAYTISAYQKLMAPKIREFLINHDIEVIHVHDMAIAQAAFDVNKKLGLPLVLDLHENRPEIMRHYGHVKSLKGRLLISPDKWEKKQEEFVGLADKVVVVTEEAKLASLEYKNKASEDIIVVPNTIHPEIYNEYPVDQKIVDRFRDEFIILYLGDTGLRRGTDTAIKAMPKILKHIDNAKLVLVGNNNSEDEVLRSLITELGLQESVVMEGWQDVSLFPSYVKSASVCISPLKRNAHHDTTFANKIFQYMAVGKPVVVSDSTAQANVIKQENCGLVHQADDEDDLAAKIIAIYDDPETAEEMGRNGMQAVANKWNWNLTSAQLINLYATFSKG